MFARMTVFAPAACLTFGDIASTQSQSTSLGVPGAVSATPSLAVSGRTVAAAWTAPKAGSTNLFLAIS